jgi:hypothetical protein
MKKYKTDLEVILSNKFKGDSTCSPYFFIEDGGADKFAEPEN